MTRPTMTPKLAKALKAWVEHYDTAGVSTYEMERKADLTSELLLAYREALAAEPEPPEPFAVTEPRMQWEPHENEADYLGSFCVEHGFDVPVDQDGCCTGCGGQALGDAVDDLIRARKVEPDAARLEVGDDVRGVRSGRHGKVVGTQFRMMVEWPGCDPGWTWERPSDLEPIPSLPPDHIDRAECPHCGKGVTP